MTKEEKVEKIEEILGNHGCRTNEMIANQIVVALEEPEERFLQNEVVGVWGARYYAEHQDVEGRESAADILKLTPEVLAATVGARIPEARWAAVDNNNVMYWYEDEPRFTRGDFSRWYGDLCNNPDGLAYNIPCPVADFKEAKWRLE